MDIIKNKVRFWFSWNSSYVRLTLNRGKSIAFSQGGPTDEGHHWHGVQLVLEGEFVQMEACTVSRDCDGPFRDGYSMQCPVERLAALTTDDKNIRCPDWQTTDFYQQDAYAEAMGY